LCLELEPFKSEPKLRIEEFYGLESTGETGSLGCKGDGPIEAGGEDEPTQRSNLNGFDRLNDERKE
jgi:hypothetical protein